MQQNLTPFDGQLDDNTGLKPFDGTLDGEKPKASGALRRVVGDTAVSLGRGIIGVPEAAVGLADLATNGQAGKLAESAGLRFKEAKDILAEQYSPEQQAANKAVQDAKGFFPTVGAMVENPSTIVNQAVESLPSAGVGGVAARGLMAAVPKMGAITAGALGEGITAAGQNAEQVRQEDPNGTLTPKQSAILGASGLLTAGISRAAGGVANKMGIGDVQTMLASGKLGPVGEEAIKKGAEKSLIRRVGEGALTEGVLQELPQSYQEQVGQNLAQGKPWDEGASAAGAQGMMAGALMGAGGNVLHGKEATPTQTPEADPQQPTLMLGNTPDPLIAFPDGTVGRQKEVDAYLDTLPEDQRAAARASLMGLGPQPMTGTPAPAPLPVKPSEAMGLDPAAGPMSSAATVAVDSGANANEIQLSQASEADQAAYNSVDLDSADKPISSGPIAESAMSDDDKRAVLYSNQPVSDGGQRYAGTQDGDILNGAGAPFASWQAAGRRASMEGKAWTIAKVADGFVARRKDAVQSQKSATPDWEAQAMAEERAARHPQGNQSAVSLNSARPPQGASGTPSNPLPQFTTSTQPAMGTQTVAKAGPQYDAAAIQSYTGKAPATDVDTAAHSAATSHLNDRPEPTQAQKEAGNYAKGHANINGLDISIENPAGSVRRGVDKDGTPWENQLQHHYGYIKGTVGNDKDHFDLFVKPGTDADYAGPVYVVDQIHPHNGKFDEHKALVGFASAEEAKAAYHSNYADGWQGMKGITEMGFDQFKAWVKNGPKNKPVANDSTSQPATTGDSNGNQAAQAQQASPQEQEAGNQTPAGRAESATQANSSQPGGSGVQVAAVGRQPSQNKAEQLSNAEQKPQPAANQAALDRIAAGNAWFDNELKARNWLQKNDLASSHDVKKSKPGRFEVVEKATVKESLTPEQKTSGENSAHNSTNAIRSARIKSTLAAGGRVVDGTLRTNNGLSLMKLTPAELQSVPDDKQATSQDVKDKADAAHGKDRQHEPKADERNADQEKSSPALNGTENEATKNVANRKEVAPTAPGQEVKNEKPGDLKQGIAKIRARKSAAAGVQRADGKPLPNAVARGVDPAEQIIDRPLKQEDGDSSAMFSRATSAETNALKALSDTDEIFAYPKSDKSTVQEIAAENDPGIKVKETKIAGETLYTLTMPNGEVARLWVRPSNPYGEQVYGMDLVDGEATNKFIGRPGENPEDAPAGVDDVYLDVSKVSEGKSGSLIYNIASTFAHNTGRIFIGDPNGLSRVAMRRRLENMISTALKFGTTDHIAPHPDQVKGDASIGVPPLKWVYGDSVGNIRRMIDVSLKAMENSVLKPYFYEPATGTFTNPQDRGRPVERVAGTSSGKLSGVSRTTPGWSNTRARAAVFNALLRASGKGASGEVGGRNGLLEGLVSIQNQHADSIQRIFYSRDEAAGDSLGQNTSIGTGSTTQAVSKVVEAIKANWANAPEVIVASSMQDTAVPERVRAYDQEQRSMGSSGNVEGFYYGGKVYLLADQLASDADVARVLFHETLGHYGLRSVFGKSLNSVLNRVAMARKSEIDAKMEQYGLKGISQLERLTAAEEVLAEMAQTTPTIGFVRDAIAAIRTWLRENIPGFKSLALTDDEIIRSYILPARGFVERGNQQDTGAAIPAFSRTMQTMTEAFRKWFGDSKVVDFDGKPMVMYHGTSQSQNGEAFDSFDTYASNYGLMGMGGYFTADPEVANSYTSKGKGTTPTVYPVYLSIKNPIDMDAKADSAAWKRQFDGIEDYHEEGDTNEAWYRAAEDMITDQEAPKWEGAEIMQDGLRSMGFDGITHMGGGRVQKDGVKHRVYVAFDPEQIKSATGNNGQFDASNADIRFSRSATLQRATDILSRREKTIVGQTNRQYTADQLTAMKNVGFQVEQPSIKERAQAIWKDAGKKLAQGIADQFAPVKDLDKQAYGLLRLSKGASGAFEAFLKGGKLKITDGVYDFDDANKGGVVDKLLIPLQGEHHDFFRWVAANRAERLAAEGRENLFTPEDIKSLKTLASGTANFDYTIQTGLGKGRVTRDRAVIYSDANRVFNEFNKNVLDMAEQSGLIDGGSRKVWERDFYVPFYRVADEDTGGVRGMSVKGSALRQQAFKELKGGKSALNADLLDNTLMNWAHLLDASAKNRAAKATIEAAERMGIATGGNQSTLASMGASINNKNGVVWFMDGGQKRYSLLDNTGDGPYIMTALSALEYAGMRNPAMNAMGAMKHALTVGVTASPFFKIRNLIRDSVQAIGTGNLSYNPVENIKDGWKLSDPKSDNYFRMLAGGGTIHFGTMLEGSEAKRVQSLVASGVDASTILDSDHKVKAFYRKFIEPGITAYNELGNRGEAINRAALYNQLIAQGVSHAEASLQARDLMDFSMQGSFTSVRFLTQVVPFFNARIQGLYKLGKAAKQDPARFGAVLGATAMVSLALLAAYSDDDDWKKREDWDRNNFWWFKFGDTAFRIPKPFEIGAIATLAERGFELAFDKEMTNKRFMEQVMTLLGDNLSMNPIPQMVKPILDVYANKDSFSGRPIETMGMDKLKSDYRFTDRTSMAARAASTTMNAVTGMVGKEALSPVQIDHMLRGYFGWLGSFAIGLADKIARPLSGQPGQAAPDYFKTATGGMISSLSDAPSRYVSAMYEQAKEIEQAHGTWRALVKEGKAKEAAEFSQKNRDALSKYRQVEHIKKIESSANQRIRMVERSSLDGDTKRELIRGIQAQKDKASRALSG